MTFLNALLTLGAAAFSVPLIIHLLNRSRYVTLDWGAMQFLRSSMRVHARRVQWKQLLLLLIRCLIPVLLALAMARPIVLSWRDSGAGNAMALVVLLDDSMSMQTVDVSGDAGSESRWRRACRELTAVADQLPAQSSVCMILAGDPPQTLANLDAATWRQELARLSEQTRYSGRLRLADGVEQGIAWLGQSSLPKRHLLVVSDFADTDWGAGSESSMLDAERKLASQRVPIPWSFLNVGRPIAGAPAAPDIAAPDLALVSMDIVPRTATSAAPLTVAATLRNVADVDARVPVVMFADHSEIERQSITIPARSTVTTRLRWTPQAAGDYEVKIAVDTQDGTPADNAMSRVMRVAPPVRVLLVDGARRSEPMKSESDFLRYALTPFALMQGQAGDPFATRVVDANGWDERLLREHEMVVCCNLPDLSPQHRQWIRDFVERGGAALFALGDGVQIERYNAWQGIAEGGLRPGVWHARSEWNGGVHATETPFFELTEQATESLSTVQVRHRFAMDTMSDGAWTGMAYGDGLPWITVYNVGRGRLGWMLSSCDDGDSNFPARPAYLPVMQKLMLFMAQTPQGWRSMEPGQRWTELWRSASAEPASAMEWRMTGQEASIAPLRPLSEPAATSDRVSELDLPRWTGIVEGRVGAEVRKMSIDTSQAERSAESNRELLADDRFASLAQRAKARHAQSAEQWLASIQSMWSGRELWLWCWGLLIALVLAEIALQQSFMPQRSARVARDPREAIPKGGTRGAA